MRFLPDPPLRASLLEFVTNFVQLFSRVGFIEWDHSYSMNKMISRIPRVRTRIVQVTEEVEAAVPTAKEGHTAALSQK